MENKSEIINQREALIEMYKAGFLDGYSTHSKPKTDEDWLELNKNYKLCFMERFEKKINKALKSCKEVKNNGRKKQ